MTIVTETSLAPAQMHTVACTELTRLVPVLVSLRTLVGLLTCVLFCLLHVQFCKANSRSCVSQLVYLQRTLTVSRHDTRGS